MLFVCFPMHVFYLFLYTSSVSLLCNVQQSAAFYYLIMSSWTRDQQIFWKWSNSKHSTLLKPQCSPLLLLNSVAVVVPPANVGDVRDLGSIPGSRRSPAGGHGNLFQYCWCGESHAQRSLVGYEPKGRKDQTLLKQLSMHAPYDGNLGQYSKMWVQSNLPAGLNLLNPGLKLHLLRS